MTEWNPERSLVPEEGRNHPFFWGDVRSVLSELAARVERVAASPLPPETLRSLRAWFRTHHVFNSNAIEGSTLTLYETQVVIGDGLTVGGKPLRDVLAARNLASALDWVEEQASGEAPISERLIKEIHSLALRGDDESLPGTYKRENNRVSGARYRTPNVLQTAPLMEALGRFLGGTMEADPILSCCIAHAWLVGIHPFRDGNGRTARLLSNIVLLRGRYPVALLTLERRPEYYAALDKAHCTGDLTDLILLWCDCVAATLDEYERLGGSMKVRERDVQYFADIINAQRQPQELEVEKWNAAVASLALELAGIARQLKAQLKVESRLVVESEAIDAATLARARSGGAPVVLKISGWLPEREFQGGVGLVTRPGQAQLYLSLVQWTGASPYVLQEIHLDGAHFRLVWPDREQRQQSAASTANCIMSEVLTHAGDLTTSV